MENCEYWCDTINHGSSSRTGRCGCWCHGSSRKDVLHHHTRRIDHGRRHTHPFHCLRKLHWPNGSRSQTHGGLGALNSEGHWSLNDCVNELHLRRLHNMDDWHRKFQMVRCRSSGRCEGRGRR